MLFLLLEMARIRRSTLQDQNSMSPFFHKLCSNDWPIWQDFDKLEGILKDYKKFLEASDSIDMSLPMHAHLAGFDEEGLKIAVHVSTHPDRTHRHIHHYGLADIVSIGIMPLSQKCHTGSTLCALPSHC